MKTNYVFVDYENVPLKSLESITRNHSITNADMIFEELLKAGYIGIINGEKMTYKLPK